MSLSAILLFLAINMQTLGNSHTIIIGDQTWDSPDPFVIKAYTLTWTIVVQVVVPCNKPLTDPYTGDTFYSPKITVESLNPCFEDRNRYLMRMFSTEEKAVQFYRNRPKSNKNIRNWRLTKTGSVEEIPLTDEEENPVH